MHNATPLDDTTLPAIAEPRRPPGLGFAILKRSMDLVVGTVAVVLLSPLLIVVAILVKLDSPGPVFHRAARVGRGGKPFRMFKFRTMVQDASKIGPMTTKADDPRITKMGATLRRFNIDELPQFIDVMLGNMSLVGPRPDLPELIKLLPEDERKAVLSVRPGITDLATLWMRNEGERLRGSADPHQEYLEQLWPTKRRLQLEYVRKRSVSLDMKILFGTLKIHLFGRLSKGRGLQ